MGHPWIIRYNNGVCNDGDEQEDNKNKDDDENGDNDGDDVT